MNGEARKDAIESQFQAKDEALQQQQNDIEAGKAAQVSRAIGGVTQAGANIASIL